MSTGKDAADIGRFALRLEIATRLDDDNVKMPALAQSVCEDGSRRTGSDDKDVANNVGCFRI